MVVVVVLDGNEGKVGQLVPGRGHGGGGGQDGWGSYSV